MDNTQIIKKTLLKYKKVFGFAFAFSLAINLLTLAMPIYSLQILDRVISSGSFETLLMLSILVTSVFICLGFLTAIRSFIFSQVGEKLDKDLSKTIFSNSISISCTQKNIQGSQMLRDFNVIKGFVSGQIMHTLFDAPWAIIFIIAIFFIHYINGLVVLSAAILLLFMAYLNELSTKKDLKEANEMSIKGLNHVELASRNAEVIEAMGMKNDIISNWNNINEKSVKLQQKANQKAVMLSSATKTIRLFIQMAMMGIGATLVLKRQMSGGGIIATSILAGKALAPFDAAITTWKHVISVRKSFSRLKTFLEKAPKRDEGIELPEPKGEIDVEKIVFTPNPNIKPIIKGISFQIKQGEIIGVIGPSGAGKTTLAKLLVGIYKPNSGTIRLDNADIYKWNRDSLGKHLGYLPQNIELFSGDVKTNIARMKDNPNSEQVINAAMSANAHEMILRLPNAYETEVGASGSFLSAGQTQQIGLARTFFGDPKLIILDEPNSHLDSQGESALIKAVWQAKEKMITMIIIAHRPSILSCVDKILVLQDGTVKLFDERQTVIDQLSGKKNSNE